MPPYAEEAFKLVVAYCVARCGYLVAPAGMPTYPVRWTPEERTSTASKTRIEFPPPISRIPNVRQLAIALPLSHGTRLGGYEIRSQLGAGGKAEVYLAFDAELDQIKNSSLMRKGRCASRGLRTVDPHAGYPIVARP